MLDYKGNNQLKGFTVIEVLISLVLTSVVITFSYSTLGFVQKSYYNYRKQNRFIREYTDLKKRMDYESLKSIFIIEKSENYFIINRDSISNSFQILGKTILLKAGGRCDTFHIVAKKITKEYESMRNTAWKNKLLKGIKFEVEFEQQKFLFDFNKKCDSSVKLELEQQE